MLLFVYLPGIPDDASRAEDALRRVHMGEPVDLVGSDAKVRSAEMTTDTDAAVPDRAETPKAVQPEGDVPYFTSDHWTGELEGLWTETDTRTAADTAIDTDGIYGPDSNVDTGTVGQQPMGNADARRQYLNGKTDLSRDADTAQTADRDVAPVKDSKAVPKPKEQIISELAPKIRTANMTSGRAMIAAEQTYTDAVKRFGPDAQIVLEQLQSGQDPRRFLDGFQNAYIAGKMRNSEALKNSGVAAYLTDSQRACAYDLGIQERMSAGWSKDILWRRNEGRIENSQEHGIMETQKFNTKADPMREVTGPGIKSHPSQIKEMVSEMERYGVEINRRGSGMAYSPGIMPGDPGQLIIEEEASYSAWMHEYKHFCDIRDAGFPGMRIFMDTAKCIRMEIDAYSIEISMAESMNRPDIVERLKALMRNEVDRFG